jgi:hypothetical protein
MYPLIKRLNIDVLRHIHSFNKYDALDLEFYKFLHEEALKVVLNDMRCFFYFCDEILGD